MSFIMFIFASMLEFISFFIFIMVLFRISIRDNFLKFVLGSLIAAFVSNTLLTESLQDISPAVNVFILFFLTSIILRTRLFHSFIMIVIGYVGQALVQWILFSILLKFDVFDEIVTYTWSGYCLQILTFVVMTVISLFIYFTHGGFSYIQSNSRFYKESFRSNKVFTVIMITGLVFLFVVKILYLSSLKLPSNFSVIALIIVAVLIVLIYFSMRKDVTK